MRLSFSYLLLITWFAVAISCKTNFVTTSSSTQNISVSNHQTNTDSQLVQIYLPYKNILEKDMNRVISISEKEMVKKRPESYLTNFLADLLLEEAKIDAKTSQLKIEPSISYFNYGGIRTSLPQGEVTVGKIFELMPFENEMVFLQFTGSQIQEFLNQLAKKGGDCLGGVRFVISNEKAKEITINGVKLDSSKKYWLVTNDYVAEGGDGLEVFTQRLEMIKSEKKIRDVLISNLERKQKNGEMLTAKLDGRIKYE